MILAGRRGPWVGGQRRFFGPNDRGGDDARTGSHHHGGGPLVRPGPLADLISLQEQDKDACLLGTAILPDPTGFGRILRDSAGRFLRIVEERDCTPEERAIREVNPSCYVFDLPGLWDALDKLTTSNVQGEYYLTDAPDWLQSMGRKVVALPVLERDDIP